MTYKDPERARAYRRQYYHLHKKELGEYYRDYRQRSRKQRAEYNRQYAQRLKRGEIQLPPLDWAICARGGSAAQAQAHRRRGEKPCPACLRADAAATALRKARMMKKRAEATAA